MFILKNPKLIFFTIVFLFTLYPQVSLGKTVQFKDKAWEIPVNKLATDKPSVRAEGSVLDLAKQQMLGKTAVVSNYLFPSETLKVVENIIQDVNQEPKSAKLVIDNNRAKEFEPGQEGQALDVYAFYKLLTATGDKIDLPVLIAQPPIKLADINSLGLKERVAVGESNFSGSPKNRIHNIKVGSTKFNGIIIKPGEEFSFNKFLGDVDGKNGFLPELVIKRTGVVPEFGGGLCQVSSTAFRAAMNAGFAITERRNHSFAVKYYAPQGTDATIYPGSTDMRFVNNLSSHLLIWTRIEGPKLYYDFYGTKDDRVVEFDGPYQYDKKADGSMKATWTRKVSFNGQTKEQTFKSTYLPPALFQPVQQPSTPNPDSSNPPPVTQ
jgi:vancomycin resistance protein YoaR